MTFERTTTAALAVLGVVVVAVLAGAFAPDPAVAGDGDGSEEAAAGAASGGMANPFTIPGWLVQDLITGLIGVWLLVVGVGLASMIRSNGLEGLFRFLAFVRDTLGGAIAFVVVLAVAIVLGFDLTSDGIEFRRTGPAPDAEAAGRAGEAAAGARDAIPPWVIFSLLVVLVFAAFAVRYLWERRRDVSGPTPTMELDRTVEAPDDPTPDEDAVDDVPPSNDVYRAWLRLADRVDAEGDGTATASDVEAAAIERGLDREPVGTLRRTFEEVRYGDRRPTEERGRRATRAIERIDAEGAEP